MEHIQNHRVQLDLVLPGVLRKLPLDLHVHGLLLRRRENRAIDFAASLFHHHADYLRAHSKSIRANSMAS